MRRATTGTGKYPLEKKSEDFSSDGRDRPKRLSVDRLKRAMYELRKTVRDDLRYLFNSLLTVVMPSGKQSVRAGSLHEHSDSRRER